MDDARILIVEDEGIEALDLQHRLTSMGYSAPDIAATGEEAVIKAEETRPDLVLMDIMLPGDIDGVTAAGQVHERFDIPVIFLTAYSDEDTLQRAKLTGPFGYLVKPFKDRDLHIAIDMALYKHKMEKKLKESREWFATTLSSIGDAVIAADKNGLITFMNPVAEGLTGWKLGEVFNKKLPEVFNIINRDTRQPVENPAAKVIREGFSVGLANHTVLIAKDGTEIPIDDSAAPIKDDRGDIIGVVLVFRDITEREKAAEEIKKLNGDLRYNVTQLEEANRELESFIYSISHDLRAPIRTMSGLARIIVEDYSDKLGAQGQDYLDRIFRGAKKSTQLIDDLLRLSKISRQELDRLEINLSDKASKVVEELRELDHDRNIEVFVQEGLTASVDPHLIELALSNLLGNAWKFTSRTEKARIEFGVVNEETSHIGLTGPVYFVRDNGAGFDPRYADKMFWPFHRLHSEEEFEGTGIGLTIVERIIHRHGGRVWAEGEKGKGATVYFTLGE